MLRALKFIIIAAVLVALAWWVGNLPGTVSAQIGAYTLATSTPAALLILVLLALLITILFRVLGGIRRVPGNVSAWRGAKRAEAGDIATQRGLVALAAGDAPAAKAEAGRARKLLGDTPLALLLAAESARLSGDLDQAKEAFRKLTQHKEMKFIGHHGLLRASLEAKDHNEASEHALAAEDSYPGAATTRAQRLELAVRQEDFSAALRMTRDRNEIAALATDAAGKDGTSTRERLRFAKQAVKANPALAPATVRLAGLLRALNKPRAARKILRNGWKAAPHPLIAEAWFAPDSTPLARAQSAAELAAANPAHVESELLLGQTSLDAGLTGEARRHAQAALDAGAKDGRAQAILDTLDGKPALKPRFAWVCSACHESSAEWHAACPACHKISTLQWRTPGTALA